MLITPEPRGLLGRTGTREKPDAVQIAVCSALSILGSGKSVPSLKKLTESRNDELAKTAEDAIKKLSTTSSE